jgi:hypothetical protein
MNLTVFLNGLILFGLAWGCYSAVVYLAKIYRKHDE